VENCGVVPFWQDFLLIGDLGAAPFALKGAGFSSMRNPLRRCYGRGDLHFSTFSCYRRRPLLGTVQARDRFVEILDEVRCRHTFRLVGYVVMPEHVHLIVSEPAKTTPSIALQVLKQKVATVLLINRGAPTHGPLSLRTGAASSEEPHFWQRRFYDFNVWSEKKLREKLDYIHGNPVKRKLVVHPKEWPWSSWAHYEGCGEGKIRIDGAWEVHEDESGR
jgi:putative transposase